MQTELYPEATLKGIKYSADQLAMIVKVQSAFRGFLTRKMVKKVKQENLVNAGMHDPNMMKGDFENEHVQVRIFFNNH